MVIKTSFAEFVNLPPDQVFTLTVNGNTDAIEVICDDKTTEIIDGDCYEGRIDLAHEALAEKIMKMYAEGVKYYDFDSESEQFYKSFGVRV